MYILLYLFSIYLSNPIHRFFSRYKNKSFVPCHR